MLAYIIRRVAQSLLVLLITGLVAFSMFSYVGDPVENMLGQERTQADIDRLRDQLGLDQPFVVQYAKFLGQAVQGNFGLSYRQGRPVSDILAERLPATLELALMAMVIALVIGLPLGLYAGLYPDRISSRVIMTGSILGFSLPTFWVGLMLIVIMVATMQRVKVWQICARKKVKVS